MQVGSLFQPFHPPHENSIHLPVIDTRDWSCQKRYRQVLHHWHGKKTLNNKNPLELFFPSPHRIHHSAVPVLSQNRLLNSIYIILLNQKTTPAVNTLGPNATTQRQSLQMFLDSWSTSTPSTVAPHASNPHHAHPNTRLHANSGV